MTKLFVLSPIKHQAIDQLHSQRDGWKKIFNATDISLATWIHEIYQRNVTTPFNHAFAILRDSDKSTHKINKGVGNESSSGYITLMDKLMLPKGYDLIKRYGFSPG